MPLILIKHIKLVLLTLFLSASILLHGQSNINFKSISPSYNNKQSFVFQTLQDSIGNIWMSTSEGMLIYNGYSYSLINNKTIFPDIEEGDRIFLIVNDEHKNIWIKTLNGRLSKYDSKTGQFDNINTIGSIKIETLKVKNSATWLASKKGIIYSYNKSHLDSITTIPNINDNNSKILDLEFDNRDNVYVSTTHGKIYKYALATKKRTEIIGSFTDYPGSIILKKDQKDKLWIGTEAHGLHVYSLSQNRFLPDGFFKGDTRNIERELFMDLFMDSEENIWGGTDGGGLYKINSKTGYVQVFKKEYFNESAISSNTIIDVNEDDHQNIWAVTKYGTISIIPRVNKHVNYLKGSDNNVPMRVLSILKAKNNTLWIGTDGAGLTKIDEQQTIQYFNDEDTGFYVQSLTEDDKNNIWFGTYKTGLWHYDALRKRFSTIQVKNNKNQTARDIRTVFNDSKGRVWIGSNVSLNVYDSNKVLLASFGNNENGLHGSIIESIIEDNSGQIWLGQINSGLFRFIENSENLNHSFFENFKDNSNETSPRIISMSAGNNHDLWLINGDNKLLIFNTQSQSFQNFDQNESIKNLGFNSIIYKDSKNIWATTTKAIVHYNRENETVQLYYTSDGLQSGNFMSRSKFIDQEGMLYFGTTKGVNYFYPDKLRKEKVNPKLVIHNIEVLNKPAKDLIPEQLAAGVFNIDKLKLKNNQSSFSVQFSAIDNILNTNYFYAYKLNGFDDNWKTTYTEGFASYTNVPSGTYTLEIKASQINDLSQSFSKEIIIVIKQPFWKTTGAYLVYIFILILLAYGVLRWYRLRKKLLINKITRRKEKDLHNTKMNFFTKMSHEIQTPITLILGPIEDMLNRAELNGNMLLKEQLHIISNNANRLSQIARELTLVRNKELNKLKLLVTQNNLHKDIHNVCLSFKELARSKQIDFSINCPKNLTNAWYDKEKLEHILYNLLSNAFKFTPQEGNVQLSVAPVSNKSMIKISVSDSGLGIQKNELDNIFKIFYRSNNKNEAKGAGIGLALTKELVALQKGKIKVKSTPNEGTTFTVKIPIAEDIYNDDEKLVSGNKETLIEFNKDIIITKGTDIDYNKKTVLVVEDNFELQIFLKNLLTPDYNVLVAENGEEGFYHAKNNVPDLIISDIMMPQMDGIQMCEELNKHNLTKHIPIILLTAKNSTKAKIEGLKTGAVEYINKPFNTNELLLKVHNIFASKELIISKYRKEIINRPNLPGSKSQDELFLENLCANINERLKDPNFKVDELAEILNMSYSSLYRKCLALTGFNLIDFIRDKRLKKGAILLAKYGYAISEAAYMVGFNDPKYFSKSFKNHFKITPREFKTRANAAQNIEDYLKSYQIKTLDFEETA